MVLGITGTFQVSGDWVFRLPSLFSRLRGRMLEADRTNRRLRSAFTFPALLSALACSPALLAHAQGTHLWTQSRLEEFEKGTPQGVALSNDGRLREAPLLKETLTTPSTFVWSIAVDKTRLKGVAVRIEPGCERQNDPGDTGASRLRGLEKVQDWICHRG